MCTPNLRLSVLRYMIILTGSCTVRVMVPSALAQGEVRELYFTHSGVGQHVVTRFVYVGADTRRQSRYHDKAIIQARRRPVWGQSRTAA